MKKELLLIFFILIYSCSFGQQEKYWQQQVNYKIDVSLNDTAKTLDGYVSMQYYNNSPDTLHFIWIHIWPNAYKNDHTAFSDQLLENGRTDFYFSSEEERGYLNRLDFKVDKATAITQDHPQHQDIIKLLLAKPLAPGTMITIETSFHVKLPFNFSRGGYIGKSFQVTQWYPKPAVYDKKGWHEMPYLDRGEFYSEFGEYDVQVTVPKDYVVAATGVLKNETGNGATKTLHFIQKDVHDFAWFADKDFAVKHDTLQLATHTIGVYAYYNKNNEKQWSAAINIIKSAIKAKSEWLGEYPYDIVSVVEKAGAAKGDGMEYPTIALLSGSSPELIVHETGHNWLYGILATNERDHPWMDEGMNTYYDKRQMAALYKTFRPGKSFMAKRTPAPDADPVLAILIAAKKDQPIETTSENFTSLNYDAVAYNKTAQWMQLLETTLGQPLFDSMMHEYYNQWKFKHPYPEDFKNVAQQVSGKNLDSIFSLLNKKGAIEKPAKKNLKITSFFSLKETDKHNYIFVSPAIGYNIYDKFMIGGIIHNYTLPVPRLKFLAAPLYATGSKKFNGLARISYDIFQGKNGQHLEVAAAGAKFTVDEYTDDSGKKNYLPFGKIVPSLKYVFANRNPRSHVVKYLQWKTFLISETGLAFSTDTVQQVDIITYPKENRYLNQLQFVIENNRVLYPYQAALQAEQGKNFIRLNFTGNYFFNYSKDGGLNVRLFAGKFIYTVDKTFETQYETDRYHLNMSGPKGYEDYTYSNYFIGRNEFEKLPNQQVMTKDGDFKVRTDLLSDKTGKTDDWLAAANFTTTIPKQINPFALLPLKIPVKLFCDVGTYAEAWKTTAVNGKFLYDAGFQVSVLKDLVNIYFPVLYSKVYREYFKSTITEKRFLKNISFSIDIQNISARKLFPQISF